MYPTWSMSGPNKNTEINKLKTVDEFWSLASWKDYKTWYTVNT